ncbi:MAG: Glutathione-regulated potassium-efflux system protein KefC [Paracidovorax wautersii]|uniref:Glutathione-regulated potassium-efflux system protein KefC n=1 Tax=Paracidovorax wautersii TaxID=1177982 RepID=A0A7V8FND9_9BURK|nr:MAG: Glutathione-regulated potassium-efflux system protein KefC [Paracidovorax wautersii]
MAAAESEGVHQLVQVVTLLGAAVVAVPLFRRLGLGSVLGYLAAGLAIGPFGLGIFSDSQAILHIADLGVVMFLFVIGLEMRPAHLWSLRRDIFGLGALQIAVCSALLTGVAWLLGWPLATAFIGASGFVLTSTAIVMQLLGERGDISQPRGQRIVSILLFEDLLIVPLLALVAVLSPELHDDSRPAWQSILTALGSLAVLLAAGRWLLNPMFRVLAQAKAREVMTAAALLVVLGAALLMQWGGLSMAMGAFLAGVLLSGSIFRHQIEADIEPFRGILLGLFFLGVGMALDIGVVTAAWPLVTAGVLLFMAVKAACIYAVARATRSSPADARDRAVLMAQGGEFAFVLFAAALSARVIDAQAAASFTAIVVLSMALTPLAVIVVGRLAPREPEVSDTVDAAQDLRGQVLIIGFGRFAQVASQGLLARGVEVSIIDNDTSMIKAAASFGFKVYYGDGTRLDVLHASGAGTAQAILVCTDRPEATLRIAELVHHTFPQARLLVRAFDRGHALKLVELGVDYQIRETLESALLFGEEALRLLGVPDDQAAEIADDVRRKDAERFELQVANGDLKAGRNLMRGNIVKPQPLTKPKREGQVIGLPAESAATVEKPAG